MTRVYKVQMFLEASEQEPQNVKFMRITEGAYTPPPLRIYRGGSHKNIFNNFIKEFL